MVRRDESGLRARTCFGPRTRHPVPVHDDVRVDHVDVGHMAVSPLLGLMVGDEGRGVGVYVMVRWQGVARRDF
jgi:hypothetical protein